MLCASFQVYPITFVQQPFYLEAAINCSHLISDPLKCLFLPPSHYFCLADSRHPAVSSTHFKICIDGLTRLHLSSRIFFGSLHASIDLCLWKSCQARYCLKYFSWPKENIFREFWWSKIRPNFFFLFAPLGTTLLNQIWNHCRIRARKTLLNEEVIFAVRQQLRHSMQSRFGMIILLFPRYQDLRGRGNLRFLARRSRHEMLEMYYSVARVETHDHVVNVINGSTS